jgi:hypothetical protein
MAAFAIAAALAAPTTTASATAPTATHAVKAQKHHAVKGKTKAKPDDHRPVGSDLNDGHALPIRGTAAGLAQANAAAAADAEVGDTKTFLGYNDVTGGYYVKTYTLRGIGDHIEVWVADDRAFPDGDCRNDLGLTEITDAQVSGFISQFDSNIYPKESATFSTPPDLNGANAPLAGLLGLPADYYEVDADQADNIVVLVDNVRDSNYYEPGTPDGQTFIAGFFSSQLNDYFNRNVMSIDAYDWLHRTGATPPDDSTDPAYQACTAELGQTRALGLSKPFDYEGVFAHEYQHLLEYYQDPNEVNWVNEGLSDYAQTVTGYVDATLPPSSPDLDGHIGCFEGYLPTNFGGPENSLTLWEDQGAPEILCDYGAAYSFMLYLFSHYGADFMSALHTEPRNGMRGLRAVLNQFDVNASPNQLVNRWAATMALDAAIDDGTLHGDANPDQYTSDALNASINWDNPQAYNSPGAPPNGSDYVRLRNGRNFLPAKSLRSLEFHGAKTIAPYPVEWVVDQTPPTATTADMTCGDIPSGSAPAALYSGCGEDLDRSIVRKVTVPAGGGQLTFDTLFDTEEDWDFGFVQVSTDGGKTWESLATEDTTTAHDPAARAEVIKNLPGFSGDSGTWRTQHADLSAYAGQEILVGFRYITDGAVDEAGFWVRNISVGGTPLPSNTLNGWKTITQVYPQQVKGWTLQLVAIGADGAWLKKVKLDENYSASLSGAALQKALGTSAKLVGAIVTVNDQAEALTAEVPYKLIVNGHRQPGGK